MARLQLQNRTRNPFKIPLGMGEINNSGERMIPPGMTGEIDADKHAQLMKANRAYGAMIEQKKLIASPVAIADVSDEELENTADPEKPVDLELAPVADGAEGEIEANVVSKGVELIEVPDGDTPPAATAKASKSAAKKSAPKKSAPKKKA